ncbi:hypothetical protein Hypma_009672, partial [Hypsizygus marmoreus]
GNRKKPQKTWWSFDFPEDNKEEDGTPADEEEETLGWQGRGSERIPWNLDFSEEDEDGMASIRGDNDKRGEGRVADGADENDIVDQYLLGHPEGLASPPNQSIKIRPQNRPLQMQSGRDD